MKLKLYQIDAFTNTIFSGNPAAVCVLDKWLDEKLMQNIAAENNLSETVFVVKNNSNYEIRWFTPTVEIDLCGHATLAAAYVLFLYFGIDAYEIVFHSARSGYLPVRKEPNDYFTLNFPTDVLLENKSVATELANALGCKPLETYRGTSNFMVVLSSQKELEILSPNMLALSKIDALGVIVTAKGDTVDFVSRFFAPQSGINEDPVTGSAHTSLIPYWSKKLNKTKLQAKQLSQRTGDLTCTYLGDRVEISGQAVLYMVGKIRL
ncbi:PhzF family phenazine biosynthesis protein [Flavicella sediminum]|uniref:PhzF family phenazine biosynthesis protein n=1 Tax=Flavicella sediminum TaxID=2585141 RepID=UPI00111F29D8|nr:PhzF family phenazine biosynthesis protein [Flavicella sediminum]